MDKERIAKLKEFLLTLNAEGWKPQRENWGDDITDLLALLDEAQIDAHAVKSPSSNGRIPDFQSGEAGSIPAGDTKPTVTREWVKNYIPCDCIDAYTDRGLVQPDCRYHNSSWEEMLHDLGITVEEEK